MDFTLSESWKKQRDLETRGGYNNTSGHVYGICHPVTKAEIIRFQAEYGIWRHAFPDRKALEDFIDDFVFLRYGGFGPTWFTILRDMDSLSQAEKNTHTLDGKSYTPEAGKARVIELLHTGKLAFYRTSTWIPEKDRNHHLVPKAREKVEYLPPDNKIYTLGPHEFPGYVPPARVGKSAAERRKESDKSDNGNERGFPINDEDANKILDQALKEQQVMLEAKKQELDEWDLNAQTNFKTWFGSTNESDKEIIKQRIDKILEMNKTYKIDKFRPASPKYQDAYAYVNPSDKEYYINLGNPFWSASMKGVDSQAGILSHEMSHFTDIGGTDDHAYGTEDSKELAKINPDKAIDNADNFEFYLENAK